MFYKRLDKGVVQCEVCFRGCVLKQEQRSFCRNKVNIDGKLYSLVHSRPSAVHIDPIEKEPAYHMFPGTEILCFGTAGCNFRCKFCHNWHLSQKSIEEMDYIYELTPEQGVDIAISKKIPTLSFTYNEPTSFYEYVYDMAMIAKEKGLNILFHSNGSMSPKPLKELLKFTNAVTIDLKGFTEEFYENTSSAKLEPCMKTLEIIKEQNKWLEIVNLLIPGLNDNHDDIKRMCLWIKEHLGDDVPLHFSRFFPNYKLTNIPATSIKGLEKAHQIAKATPMLDIFNHRQVNPFIAGTVREHNVCALSKFAPKACSYDILSSFRYFELPPGIVTAVNVDKFLCYVSLTVCFGLT